MKLFRFALVGICLLMFSLPSFAQDTQTAEWGDLGLAVDYPDDWDFDDSGESALLVVFNDELAVYFYEPREARDAETAIEDLIENNEGTDFEFDDILEAEVMGEEAFRVDYESPGFSGFSLAFEFNGDVLLLDAGVFDDRLSSSDEEILQEIIDTLHPSDGGGGGGGDGDIIESATDEDSTGEDIVDELIDLGLVEDGGDFLFEEDSLSDDADLPESYEGGNIAMGAIVSFERAEDDDEDTYRICTFVAQSNTDDLSGEEGAALVVGIGSDGFLITSEFDLEDFDNSIFESFEVDVDVEDENHLLLLVSNDEATLYVNGEAVVEGWELDLTAGNDELFTGYISDLGCSMTNVWAYSFE